MPNTDAKQKTHTGSKCRDLYPYSVNSIFSASPKRGQAFRSSCSRALTSTVGQGWTLGAGHDDISCAKRAQAASCVVNFIKLMIMYRSLQSGAIPSRIRFEMGNQTRKSRAGSTMYLLTSSDGNQGSYCPHFRARYIRSLDVLEFGRIGDRSCSPLGATPRYRRSCMSLFSPCKGTRARMACLAPLPMIMIPLSFHGSADDGSLYGTERRWSSLKNIGRAVTMLPTQASQEPSHIAV
jgi:hypothetical protein